MPSPFLAVSPTSIGDGTELVVLWDSGGLALSCFLFFVLVVVRPIEVCGSPDPASSVSCDVVAEVTTCHGYPSRPSVLPAVAVGVLRGSLSPYAGELYVGAWSNAYG